MATKQTVTTPSELMIQDPETGELKVNEVEVERFFRIIANTINDHEARIETLEP